MHVMVGTDGSEGGDRAVDMAAKFATAAEAKLLVMTVVNDPPSALDRHCRRPKIRARHSGRTARASKQRRPICCRADHRARHRP